MLDNPHFTPDIAELYIDKYMNIVWETKPEWLLDYLSKHISLDIIKKYPNEEWNWYIISERKDITMDIVEKNPELDWCFTGLSWNPNLTLDFFYKHKDNIDWNFYALSRNPCITIDFILDYKDKSWDWDELTIHKNITFDMIKDTLIEYKRLNFDVKEDFKQIMKVEGIHKYGFPKWNIFYIPANPNITLDFIKEYPYSKWDYQSLFSHIDLSINMIDKLFEGHIRYFWKYKLYIDWTGISSNPKLTLEMVDKYIDNLDFISLSSNTFKIIIK